MISLKTRRQLAVSLMVVLIPLGLLALYLACVYLALKMFPGLPYAINGGTGNLDDTIIWPVFRVLCGISVIGCAGLIVVTIVASLKRLWGSSK